MLVLLPFLIVGVGVSTGICSAAGFSGGMLALMLVLLFLAGFVGALALFFLYLLIITSFVDQSRPQPRPSRFYQVSANYLLGLLTVLSRIRLHVSGTEKIPEERFLLVCNHRSNYDPIVTGWALRRFGLGFVSKPENMRRFIVGNLAHKCGYLPIDRDNDRAALKTILEAAARLRSGAMSFGVYPEGTRHAEEEMLPFRCGAFKIAQKADVPIVIAAIRGTDDVCKNFPWRATDVELTICGVLDRETVRTSKTTEIGDVVRECITSANT